MVTQAADMINRLKFFATKLQHKMGYMHQEIIRLKAVEEDRKRNPRPPIVINMNTGSNPAPFYILPSRTAIPTPVIHQHINDNRTINNNDNRQINDNRNITNNLQVSPSRNNSNTSPTTSIQQSSNNSPTPSNNTSQPTEATKSKTVNKKDPKKENEKDNNEKRTKDLVIDVDDKDLRQTPDQIG